MAARLGDKVDRSGEHWLWTGQTNHNGYGVIETGKHPRRPILAHRAAWEDVAGPIPDGMSVLHTCDLPACLRNDDEGVYELGGVLYPRRGHLFLGDHLANMLDMKLKGRHHSMTHPGDRPKGEQVANAILNADKVRAIRARVATGETETALALEYAVGLTTISAVVRRQNWRHIE